MALTSCDFSTTFKLETSPKKFSFTDTTDYGAQGVGLNEVTGIFKIVDPTGSTIYNNTDHNNPDINPDVALTNSTTIPLPLDANGKVLAGNYTITYTVRGASGTIDPAVEVTNTQTVNFNYASPVASLDITVNCLKPLITSTDTTNYKVNNVTPSITRDHQLHYPASLQLSPETGTGAILQNTTLYTGENSSSLTSTLTYEFTNYTVTDEVTASKVVDVECDDLCDVYCCLRAQYLRYDEQRGVNKILADRYLATFIQMVSLAELAAKAIECGKEDDVSGYVTQILKLGNCEPGCGCSGNEPVAVVGLGGPSVDIDVKSGGSPVVVNKTTEGSTTVYTITLATAFANKVNDSFTTTVAAGTGISVVESIDENGNKTYTVTNASASGHAHQTILLEIDFNQNSTVPVVTKVDETITGSVFQAAAVANVNNASYAQWQQNKNHFRVSDYLVTAGTNNKPMISLIKLLAVNDSTVVDGKPLDVEIFDYNFTNKTFDFTFFAHGAGQRVTGGFLDNYGKAYLSIVIHR